MTRIGGPAPPPPLPPTTGLAAAFAKKEGPTAEPSATDRFERAPSADMQQIFGSTALAAGPATSTALTAWVATAADLTVKLDGAKVPAKVRDGLIEEVRKRSGAAEPAVLRAIDTALAGKDPVGDLKSLLLTMRTDSFFDSYDASYKLPGGTSTQATPHFRMSDGFSGPKGRTAGHQVQDDLTRLIQKHDAKAWTPAMKNAVHMVAYGRPTAEQVKVVTQALIDGGQFEATKKANPGLSDADTVRMMQWNHGIGIDCAGYVQQAFLDVHGGSRKDFGFKSIGEENLMSLKRNPHFTSVKPENVKTGDLITLDPPKAGDVGHTVLVRDHHVASDAERSRWSFVDGFAKKGETVHVYVGDASWGAGQTGKLDGGLQRRTWLYNESTGKWAELKPDGTGGLDVKLSNRSGPADHPMNGIYRPKS